MIIPTYPPCCGRHQIILCRRIRAAATAADEVDVAHDAEENATKKLTRTARRDHCRCPIIGRGEELPEHRPELNPPTNQIKSFSFVLTTVSLLSVSISVFIGVS